MQEYAKSKTKSNSGKYSVVLVASLVLLFTALAILFVKLYDKYVEENGNPFDTSNSSKIQIEIEGSYYEKQIDNIVFDIIKAVGPYPLEKYRAFHDFVITYCEYTDVPVEQNDDISNSEALLETGYGNSVAYAKLYRDLCRAAGLYCETIQGEINILDSRNKETHTFNVVTIENKVYFVDCCCDEDNGMISYDWFLQGEGTLMSGKRRVVNEFNFELDPYPVDRQFMKSYKFNIMNSPKG